MLWGCENNLSKFHLNKAAKSLHGQKEHSCLPPTHPQLFVIVCHTCNLQKQPLQAFLLFPKVGQWANNISHCMSITFFWEAQSLHHVSCTVNTNRTQQGKPQHIEFCCYCLTLLRRKPGGGSSFPPLQEECWKGRRISMGSRALLLWNSKFAYFTSNQSSILKTQT